ncbi:hypothetical protein [Streptomyces sp. NPDC005485]|uniref:hypothetical protein n=1 Tax=Streptomyces sp. NPDC005485 TaxID=3155591 RepID=UPI0033BCE5CB
MFEYELHQTRSADLLAAAQHDRLVREALRARAARRAETRASGRGETSAQDDAEARSHSRRPRRHRFARAA